MDRVLQQHAAGIDLGAQAACAKTLQSVEIAAAATRNSHHVRAPEQKKVKSSRFFRPFSRFASGSYPSSNCTVTFCAQREILLWFLGIAEIFS